MTHIERLTHLATEGDPTAEAHANRERRRRGLPLVWFACPLLDGQCGGVKHEPPMTTLEELREWAEVEFFADGLTADISTQAFTGWAGVFLYRIDAPTPRRRQLASVWLSADGRPRFRFFDVVVERSNYVDFCVGAYAVQDTLKGRPENVRPLMPCLLNQGRLWLSDHLRSRVCLPRAMPLGSCT